LKKLLAIIVLSLYLITPSQADDISDFQIEGMSLGDSLLDYFKKTEIKKGIVPLKKTNYKDDSFLIVGITKNPEVYDTTQFHIKKDDPKYIIYNVTGKIFYKTNINECYEDMQSIVSDVENLNLDTTKNEYKKNHSADKTGNSKNTTVQFDFSNGDAIRISCYDWSKKMKHTDNLRLAIIRSEYSKWLNTKAYK
jgi:hypothetical protein